MAEIYQKDRLYDLLVPYINRTFRWSYKDVEYRGISSIPRDGAVIFAVNHSNSLMDALAVLSMEDRPVVFVARADIFKKAVFNKILTFLKIMPINRIRDGVDSLQKNDKVIAKCVETLEHKIPFCILPEGTHRPKHSLLPLRKGITRIAMGAYKELKKKGIPLYIVPVGLEYQDYFKFRSKLLVNIGRPINVGEFVADKEEETTAIIMRSLLQELENRMKETIIYIPDDERYESIWQGARILYRIEKQKPKTQYGRLRWMQKTIDKLKNNNILMPEKQKDTEPKTQWFKIIALLPLAILALFFMWPAFAITAWAKKAIHDSTFNNSIRYVASYVINPLLWFVITLLVLLICQWWWALLFVPLTIALPVPFYEWYNATFDK